MKKRDWIYISPPSVYGIRCDQCGGKVEWSEFEECVWCPKCQIDTIGSDGVFSGPIPLQACRLLGISYDRIDLETGKILRMKLENDKLVWK